ncbi:MAG: feruloyl-CoA synthetase [Rhodocyclales bacterium CG_4_10_14_3_um_filter_68_10]|nr:MAG: feruloyl-CoA synthetase [Rhodocyclales bacterium CG_4_10_14_3_um_filter_68_10]
MDLSGWIDGWARLAPSRVALRFERRDLTYAAFAGEVHEAAAALARAGIGRGACVAWLGTNSPSMLALLFACARLGAIFMPLNWRLAPPEHCRVLRDCTPRLLFVEPEFVGSIDCLFDVLSRIQLVTLGHAHAGWMSWAAFVAGAGTAAPPEGQAGYDDPVLLCYTSGSTGSPKGAMLTQAALFWNAVNNTHLHGLTGADRVLTTLPLFHVGGLNNQTLPALHAGATVVLHARFDADATFDAIEAERISLTVLVPAQLDMMIRSPRWRDAALGSLRMIATGSSVIPERISRAVHARGIPLVQIYGATETCPIATVLLPEDAMRKPASAGRPAVHCRVKIVDEAGADVPAGVSGEVLVQGPNVMTGYWKQPEESARVLRGGWFHSGDIGYFDEAGFLFINGRKKDMIISGGENVYPAEIENVLSESPDIAEVAVVGEPDERWGEAVVAVVVPRPGARIEAAQVLDLLDGRIACYKHPRRVVLAEALPRTALGKIRKEAVREMVLRAPRAE